ncbi:MAG TPA: bifunctional oligoribonuclease/PAP phosphatase NrnA, partial [Chloroflexia bacterium]|nr:bifunctional oligoribonuclease/PAP phosphatase NrnA [Chloroflexia bacterium]
MAVETQTAAQPSNGTQPRPEAQLRALLEARRGERHVIVLQNFPDPDAISTAYAHQLISANFGIETDTVYTGKVSHEQNVALLKLLGIKLILFTPELDLNRYAGSVFVDNQGTTAEHIVEALDKAHVPALVVVDHHSQQDRVKPLFADIRRVGATATIYTEYLRAGLLTLDRDNKEHQFLATALMHGLLSDTGSFVRAGAEDFEAAAYLSGYRDAEILAQIMSQARSKQTLEIVSRALINRVVTENFSIAGIGYVRAEHRDAIPQAADFLLTEENVHTALVYGIVTGEEEDLLIGSLRTSKLTLDPDSFIKETFGKSASGHYFGGGKMSAAGFQVPLGFLSGDQGDELRDLKWEAYDRQVKKKVFARLGVEGPNMAATQPGRPAGMGGS